LRFTKRLAVVALAVFAVVFMAGCASTPGPGEIGVVRNGKAWYNPLDWFDNHNIRGHVANGSGNTWTGMGSDVHYYPVDTQQRFFKMETCRADDGGGRVPCDGADTTGVRVPTADGVEVEVEGTFYLDTVFNNTPNGLRALDQFDTQFSTRPFGGKHPFEGTEGWSHFLAAIVTPIVNNNLRDIISGVRCAQLLSSCALVQNTNASDQQHELEKAQAQNRQNIANIQQQVQVGLAGDLKETLGRDYFNPRTIQFKLSGVNVPGPIQQAIDEAQASYAAVSKAQATAKQAQAEASANINRQRGYAQCPACAQIDIVKAIPSNVTTFAPGGNFAVASK
jgi:hypothetical protein